ncbi:MAG: hypothetical protein K2J81_04970 [Treponemataceae bacterium]|nr:hypothetical protein [Treponemataceae bacterium]
MGETLVDGHQNDSARTGYTLPAWRLFEVMGIALKKLYDAGFCAAGFDCIKMITGEGITLRGYSSFLPENLERMRPLSKGIWQEGLCLILPADDENPAGVRMICYDDSYKNGAEMLIILHEYGHIVLKHTEQSMNGEAEAICFATAMFLMLTLEKQGHLAKKGSAEFARLMSLNRTGGAREKTVG